MTPVRRDAALLEVHGLAAAPPGADHAVVSGVSLEVRSGEWLAITGANGGGKSTLAMALAGLWPASAGAIRMRGRPLAPGDHGPRREIAVVFQDPSSQLLQDSVREELGFAARNLDLAPERIERSIARVALELGLSGELERDPRTLSAGRQQLVLLGAALVAEPALLVADEPGAHLDPDARSRALAMVRARVDQGLAVVWVTQDEVERAAADREIGIGPSPSASTIRHADGSDRNGGPPVLEVGIGPPPVAGPSVRIPGLTHLVVPATGMVAVVGSNGSGKTVLLSAMAGLLTTCQVELDWRIPHDAPPIFAAQYPEMQIFEERVGAEIEHAALRRGRTHPDLQRTISQCLAGVVADPPGFLQRRCWTLSAGEKRLVGILGALLAPAPLVLLDEPTAGLDSGLRSAVGGMVAARAAEVPVVMATQDRTWAAGLGAVLLGASVR